MGVSVCVSRENNHVVKCYKQIFMFFRLSAQQNDLTSKKHVDKADFINNLRRAVNDDNHICVCVCVFVYFCSWFVCLFVCIDVARADNLATAALFVVLTLVVTIW